MAKNIKIQEGGKSYNFSVETIKTGLTDDDYQTWIPEDTNVIATLAVNKHWKTYYPEDYNVLGFSEVTVDETGGGVSWDYYPALGEADVSIREDGTQEDYTAVSRIDIDSITDGERELFVFNDEASMTTKSVTVDGDTPDAVYHASDDNVIAYSEFTVRGLADSIRATYVGRSDSYFAPGGSIFSGFIWTVKPIYEDGKIWSCPEYTGDPTSESTFFPETVPDDGSETFTLAIYWPRYDDGEILTTELTLPIGQTTPSYISVTTLPTTTTYENGETIDYTGIVVTAYKEDGTIWHNEDYENGIIPFDELVFAVTTANVESGGKITDLVPREVFSSAPPFYLKKSSWGISGGEAMAFFCPVNGNENRGWVVLASHSEFDMISFYGPEDKPEEWYNVTTNRSSSATYYGKTVYYNSSNFPYGGIYGTYDGANNGSDYGFGTAYTAWTMIYGTASAASGTQILPVSWTYNGNEYNCDFEISVE